MEKGEKVAKFKSTYYAQALFNLAKAENAVQISVLTSFVILSIDFLTSGLIATPQLHQFTDVAIGAVTSFLRVS